MAAQPRDANANDRLARCLLARDGAGARAALRQGADPDAINLAPDAPAARADPLLFHLASRKPLLAMLTLALRHGANPNLPGPGRRSPLHEAARSGSPRAIQALLARGAQIEARDAQGNTALHRACLRGSWPAVSALLAAGANPNARNARELSSSPLACAIEAATGAAWSASVRRILRALIEHPEFRPDLALSSNSGNVIPLFNFCNRSLANLRLLFKLLGERHAGAARALARSAGLEGLTPLHYLATGSIFAPRATAAAIDLLLALGADIEARDAQGQTPMHWATEPALIRILALRGARVNARSLSGATPLQSSIESGQANQLANAALLLRLGADPWSADEKGRNAFELAAASSPSVLDLLRSTLARQERQALRSASAGSKRRAPSKAARL